MDIETALPILFVAFLVSLIGGLIGIACIGSPRPADDE